MKSLNLQKLRKIENSINFLNKTFCIIFLKKIKIDAKVYKSKKKATSTKSQSSLLISI